MPFDLVEKKNDFTSDWKMGNDTGREIYQLNQWKSPPKDYLKWQFLVEQFVKHLYERYGQQINQWFFKVWNEPDLTNYWTGTIQQYCQLYDHSVQAIHKINPNFKVGGPAVSDAGNGFLKEFLEHVTRGNNYANKQIGTKIDFISFHTKGLFFIRSDKREYLYFRWIFCSSSLLWS